MIKTCCFHFVLREKPPFFYPFFNETPYVHRYRQNLRQHLEKHDKSALSLYRAFHISISVWVPIDQGPCNFAFFHTRGADGLLFGIPQRFRPAPRGSPGPRTQPYRYTPELRSILVLRGVILVSGLDAVVTVAEALPVAPVPEENTVSSVRFDVIDIGRLDVVALLHALHTQRMCLKVTLAGSVPRRAVASAAC